MKLSFFNMIKNGVTTIIEIVDAGARESIASIVSTIEQLKTVAFSGSYNDLSDKPVIPTPPVLSDVAYTGEYNDLLNKPTLFSGDYNDLSNKPTLFSGNYNDLTNKPTIPTVTYNDASGWGRLIMNNTGIIFTTTAGQSINFNTAYGSRYWADVTINIPSGVRLSVPINLHVTCLASTGLLDATILSFTNSAITLRVCNDVQGSVSNVKFCVTMIGGV